MENQLQFKVRVGLFILIGLTVVMSSIVIIGGDRWFFKKHVLITATFGQVQGLQGGSIVSFMGIPIGNVKKIEFNPATQKMIVTAKVQEHLVSQIPKDSLAEIRTQGALGDKFIFIQAGSSTTEFLEANSDITTQIGKDFLGVLSERGKDTEKVFEIINELYTLTKTINGDGRLNKTLENLSQASEGIKKMATSGQQMVANIESQSVTRLNTSLEKMDKILSKIDRGEGTLGALINDPSIHDKLKAILGGSDKKTAVRSLLRNSLEKSDGKSE